MHIKTESEGLQMFYLHSHPVLDPKNLDKRLTVCGIIDPLSTFPKPMRFGICGQNSKFDHFERSKGRKISLARAINKSILTIHIQDEKDLRIKFLETARIIVEAELRPRTLIVRDNKGNARSITGYKGNFKKQLERKRDSHLKELKQTLRELRVLNYWTGHDNSMVGDIQESINHFEKQPELLGE